jgi:putative transposase
MDEQHERRLRRQAIRLTLKEVPAVDILGQVHRSRSWLCKWRQRFGRLGWEGLRSASRQAHHCPHAFPSATRRQVLNARRRLQRRRVGLIGPRAIRRELRQAGLRRLPSLATIKRILRDAGLTGAPAADTPAPYFPRPTATPTYPLTAMDWASRYLEGGAQVFAFHTLHLGTRACQQTIATDKTAATAHAHLLQAWQRQGIPDALQVDNDAAFTGGPKAVRFLSPFVRLCLYVGVEVIFLPVQEPEHNGDIEALNRLWNRAFWTRQRFRSVAAVRRAGPAFESWYAQEYEPPKLAGQTPAEAQRAAPRRRLRARQARQIPEALPITAGRVHFIRRVRADGTVQALGESWRVGQRLAGQYVWVTLWTHRQQLEIYHRRSEAAKVRLVKRYAYPLGEKVVPLKAELAPGHRRRRMFTML